MEYREIPLPRELAPFVAAMWTLRGVCPAPSVDLVLPDGCAEIVVHRTGRFREWRTGEGGVEQSGAIVAGVMDRAVALSPAAAFETIGLRLLPHCLARLCADPLDAMSHGIAPAEAVLTPLVAHLLSAAAQAHSLERAARILQRGMIDVFARTGPPPFTAVAAVRRIWQSGGRVSVDRLVAETGATARALERQFDRWVGLSPKRYGRVVRFHRAVDALISAPDVPVAALAADHGYYDQAHLTRDFKAFTGWAPRSFLTGRLGELTRHFVTGPRSDSSKTPPAEGGESGERGGSQ